LRAVPIHLQLKIHLHVTNQLMLVLFTLWILKKLFPRYSNSLSNRAGYLSKFFFLPRIALLITAFLLSSFFIFSQDRTLKYDILYKGNIVGDMQINKRVNDENVYLMMISRAKMRFFTSYKVYIEEQSLFNKGKLVYTSVYREVNGKVKANHKTKAAGDIYLTEADGKTGSIKNKPINSNLILLYFYEPVNLRQVYSGNFQQFVDVRPVGDHTYKIDLPDGNYNYYTYRNGICVRVEVHNSMYTISMELKD
jgi:hypothetical protein